MQSEIERKFFSSVENPKPATEELKDVYRTYGKYVCASHNAMFEELYTCETDPMIGAGLDAARTDARTAAPNAGKVTEAELENVAITLFDLSWFIDDAPASENGERIGNTTWTTFESGVASALADPDKYLVGARMRFHDLLSEQERKRWMMLARAAISALGLEVEG